MSSTSAHMNYHHERGKGAERESEPPVFRISLLGGFHLSADGQLLPSKSWRSRKAANLVKLLALAPDHSLHREQITETLWPEHRPSAAGNNLRQTLFIARKQLQSLRLDSSLLLSSQGDRVKLYPEDKLWIDIEDFEAAAARVHESDDPADYWSAIERYTGPLLPDDLYEDWTTACREALATTYLSLLHDVTRIHERSGDYSFALTALRRITEAEPSDESAHVRLMRIYASTGRRPLALRQYGQLVHTLAHELDAAPEPETEALYQAIKNGTYPAKPTIAPGEQPSETSGVGEPSDRALTNLPLSLSSFVGRERDVDEVSRRVSAHRLVTLTGVGGSGKTRLALEVGWRQLRDRSIPVWLVELAALNDPSLIPESIADVLDIRLDPGVEALTSLAAHLRDRCLLLILDNCEHLIAACAGVVQTLLSSCPNLSILVTSRQAVRVSGEHPWLVPPLPLPESNASLSHLSTNDSVRLFFDRVHEHRADLSLNASNASAVATICRRLEGLPLGLELAAARTTVLTVQQLADRLDDALGLLVGGHHGPDRQQTLRATLDWSYALLSPPQQRFLQRLAVFRGSWTLDAAEAVAVDPGGLESALDLLSNLVEQSLVQVDLTGEEARYWLLEPVRQYAVQCLNASEDASSTHERHASFYLSLATKAEAGLNGPEQTTWLSRLDRAHDNLRAALEWLINTKPGEALEMVAHLARYWELRAYLTEGPSWIARALAQDGSPTLTRARVLVGAGTLAWRSGNYVAATRFHQESMEIFRAHEDARGVALALVNLGAQAMNLREFDRAIALYSEGLDLADQLKDDNIRAMALINLGLTTLALEDFDRAESYFTKGLAVSERLQNKHYISVAVQNLGEIAHHLGNDERALTLLRQSLQLSFELEAKVTTAFCLEEIAAIQVNRGEDRLAARLIGASDVIRTDTSSPAPDIYQKQLYDPTVAAIRGKLGEKVFTSEWEAGAAMPLALAVAQALTEDLPGKP